MKSLVFASGLGILLGISALAQEVPPFTFNLGAGFTHPVGNTGRALDAGWNGTVGAGFNFNSHFGANLQFNFNQLGINRTTLDNFGAPDGLMRVWSLTVDPIVHLNHRGPLDVYLVGGGGLYHRYHEFTEPSVAVVPVFDPLFGFFPAAIPANNVLASYSVYKPGWNGGAGLSFGTPWKAKFFAEARYHQMFMSNTPDVKFVPVTFGFRF
jgi:opacity protein-like surface antigen